MGDTNGMQSSFYDSTNTEEYEIDEEEKYDGLDYSMQHDMDASKQNDVSLDDLFGNLCNSFDGKQIAFADNSVVESVDLDEEQEDLMKLYDKYPQVDKAIIQDTYEREDKNYDLAVFQLDTAE